MKHFTHYFSLMIGLLAFGLFSCESSDDESQPTTITYESNVPKGSISVNYTVQVVPGNNVIEGRTTGVEGATVTITQNGETQVATTDQFGMAHFIGMNNGSVTGTVERTGSGSTPGVIPMAFRAMIDVGPVNTENEQIFYSSSLVTAFELNSALGGRIWGNYIDLPASALPPPEIGSGEFTLPTNIFVRYNLGNNYPKGSGNGRLEAVNLSTNSYSFRTSAAGTISLGDIPGTVEGVLEGALFMEDLEVLLNPASSNVTLFNIQPVANSEGMILNIIPGMEYQLGDIEAMMKL